MTIDRELELITFVLPRILTATLCGAIIGFEREWKKKVAGLKTMVLITVGSCIFTIAALVSAEVFHSDPDRIISTIVTGIGFLGGGVIMKNEDRVIGITTAAFIWVVSGIGILCGMGTYLMPSLMTLGLLIISLVFQKIETKIHQNHG